MADIKARIAKRVAKEFKNGDVVNLGIGLPTMVAQYVPEDVVVTLHSENGFAGLDAILFTYLFIYYPSLVVGNDLQIGKNFEFCFV